MSLHDSSPLRDLEGRFVVRPAHARDVEAFNALVITADGRLERHAESVDASRAVIAATQRSLAGEAGAAEKGYLLLLEDAASGELAGCVGLTCNVGLDQPFYEYRVGKIVHSSRPLKSYRCLDVLYLCNDLTGCSELHSLYVRAEAERQGGAAQLLKAAQLFIASRPHEFAPRIIAELRGVQDLAGASPFWEAVGRHFFKVDQRGAERLVAQGSKAFIAELMPKHPVYLDLLPETAQQAAGGMHQGDVALASMMEEDGFHFENHIDIFDAGRVLEAHTRTLRGVVESRLYASAEGQPAAPAAWWVSAGGGEDFRMSLCDAEQEPDRLLLAAGTPGLIHLTAGAPVRALRAG